MKLPDRIFAGLRYIHGTTYKTKTSADNAAKVVRDMGWKARVVTERVKGKRVFNLYYRK